MYKVYWTNFGYYADCEFSTIEAAITHGKGAGFEFSVRDKDDNCVAAYTAFSGVRYYR